MPTLADVDLVADRLPGRELHDVLATARETDGLARVSLLGAPGLAITRHAELKAFFADDAQFPGGESYQFMVEPAVGRTFISMDGDEHDAYRRLATPAFRSRRVSTWVDDDLVPLAHEIVDRFAARGEADLVVELTQVLPLWAISRKLGLPMGSEERQRVWTRALLAQPADPDGAARARAEVTAFLAPIVTARRDAPGDDVLSHLLGHEHEGLRMTDEEVVSHIRLLYVVGAATTSDGLSSLLFHLLSRPALLDRARQEPDLRPRVVAESLRYDPPVCTLPRLAPTGGTIGSSEVAPGTLVLCAIASANRDPRVFPDPDRFDPDRDHTEMLTFGFGQKYCPGAHLGRSEIAAALDVVLERLPNLRLVDATEPAGAIMRSVDRLQVAWDPIHR
ncbi:MAG: cytochrome P450 [Actinobacteria bacterium]|nr:cytochrome P450 [Actinomycetota bacterium]